MQSQKTAGSHPSPVQFNCYKQRHMDKTKNKKIAKKKMKRGCRRNEVIEKGVYHNI